MEGFEAKVSETETDFWEDIMDLLKKVSDKDPEVLKELNAIMNKHDDVYHYSIKKEEAN
jgi:hypothetical protein